MSDTLIEQLAKQRPATDADMQEMERPWRLGAIGIGLTASLVARLLAANGVIELQSRSVSLATAATALFVGFGLLLITAQRDRFTGSMGALTAALGVAYAALSWMTPFPIAGIDRTANVERFASAAVGAGVGVLIAGVLLLALVRRSPTLTVALTLAAGVMALAASTVFRSAEWIAITLVAVAFGFLLGAWDRSPRREVHFNEPDSAPRGGRAALCLTMMVIAGAGIDYWIRHGRNSGNGIVPLLLCGAAVCVALFALLQLRRELQRRATPLSEWTSWVSEIRTNEFRREFEEYGPEPPAPDSPFADLGDPLNDDSPLAADPPLDMIETSGASPNFFDALADREPSHDLLQPSLTPPTGEATESIPQPAEPAIPEPEPEPEPEPAPAAQPPTPESAAAEAKPDPQPAAAAPTETPEAQAPEPVAAEAAAAQVPAIVIPTLDGPATTLGAPAESAVPQPLEPQPSPPPAAAAPAAAAPIATAAPRATGAFSAQVAPEAPAVVGHEMPSLADFDDYLQTVMAPDAGAQLFVAIECTYLTSMDQLDAASQSVLIDTIGAGLADLAPQPMMIAWIDGPYFILAYDSSDSTMVRRLNKQLRVFLSSTVSYGSGEIALRGTLAFLAPRATLTLDQLLDDAVAGLISARNLASPGAAV